MLSLRHTFALLLFCVASACMAQSSRGDQLFAEGEKLQRTLTISSQNAAIQKFKKAKIAYSSAVRKAACDTQIGVCNGNITRLKKRDSENARKPDSVAASAAQPQPEAVPRVEVTLSLSKSRLDFKYKPKTNQTVSVDCNRDDWEIASYPEWLKVYTAANEFSVIAEENTGEERSGIVTVRCGVKEASVIINQDKIKGLNKIVKNIKGK